MTLEGFLILAANFILIALVPVVLKHQRRFSWTWCLIALPFLASFGSLIAVQFDLAPDFARFAWIAPVYMRIASMLLCIASISLIMFALGTNRGADASEPIATRGVKGRIRHPFYASGLLTLLACGFYCPQIVTLLAFLYGATAINVIAEREEKRLSASAIGKQYKEYITRTGRFVPRFGR